jgi:hypothetical protein
MDEMIYAEPGDYILNFMQKILNLAEDTKKTVMGNHNERIIIVIPNIYKKETEKDENDDSE